MKLIFLYFGPVVLVLLWYLSFMWSLLHLIILTVCLFVSAFILTLWCHVALSSPHQTSLFLVDKVEKDIRQLIDMLKEEQNNWPQLNKRTHLPVIFGRTVDGQLQQLLDYILRDFLTKWMKGLAYKPEPVVDKFKEHLWTGIKNLHERLLKVDAEKLIANEMVTRITHHFEKIRIAQSYAIEHNEMPVFAISPHLMSYDTEIHYLRQISDLIIIFLLPRSYSLNPATHLVREVVSCKILQPAIDLLTDPDYIIKK